MKIIPSSVHVHHDSPIQNFTSMRDTIWTERNSGVTVQRSKPTVQIYRPPGGRQEIIITASSAENQQLNVHAKEFTMKHNDFHQNNKNMTNCSSHYLQHSKSSSNIQRHLYTQQSNQSQHPFAYHEHHGHNSMNHHGLTSIRQFTPTSSGTMLHIANHGRVHFHVEPKPPKASSWASKPGRLVKSHSCISTYGLKRSKSFNNDTITFQASNISDIASLGKFPAAIHDVLIKAIKDPNVHNSRTLMELVRHILNRVVENRRYAEPAAKICIKIIEQEVRETFLESLLNTCQQWYQDHSKLLVDDTTTTCHRFPAGFMTFLNEMYCQLKRRQLQLRMQQEGGIPPGRVLLALLCKCCQDYLQPSIINSLTEVDCLFLILTSIGQDLHTEMPTQLEQLLASVRNAFLGANATLPAVKKILLQIIELHAAYWQLPAPALVYYYPGSSKS